MIGGLFPVATESKDEYQQQLQLSQNESQTNRVLFCVAYV